MAELAAAVVGQVAKKRSPRLSQRNKGKKIIGKRESDFYLDKEWDWVLGNADKLRRNIAGKNID